MNLEYIPRKGEECVFEYGVSNRTFLGVKKVYHHIQDNEVLVELKELNVDRSDFESVVKFLMSKGWKII
jgi:hypothetical protein